MAEDRPIAPGPGRHARAHAGGMRPDARWLAAGIACVAGSVVVGACEVDAVAGGLRVASLSLVSADAALRYGVRVWVVIALVALGAALLTGVLSGNVGPIDRRARAQVGGGVVRAGGAVMGLGTLLGLLVLFGALDGVLAAAARAVDAPPEALARVWQAWAARGLAVVGALLCGLGGLEIVSWRSARWHALHQTVDSARREAREHQRKSAP